MSECNSALRAEPAGAGLPVLPEPRAIRAGNGFPKVYALAYTADQLREYGEACATPATRCRAEGGNTSQVGCERDDGLLNIHAESETCEVCSAPAAGTEKDAERYRWLRDEARSVDWSRRFRLGTTPAYTYCCRHSPEQMDAEIDAAILAHTKAREGA